jgi:hypothetical protein
VIIIAACIPPMRHLFVSFLDKSAQGGSSGRFAGRQSYVPSQRHHANGIHSRDNNDDEFPLDIFQSALHGKAMLTRTAAYHEQVVAQDDKGRFGVHGDAESEEFILPTSYQNDNSKGKETVVNHGV